MTGCKVDSAATLARNIPLVAYIQMSLLCPNFHVYKPSQTLPRRRTLLNSFLLPSIRWKRLHRASPLLVFHFCATRGSRIPGRRTEPDTKRSAERSRVLTTKTSSPSPSSISLLPNSPARPTHGTLFESVTIRVTLEV
jgi:hypothetical protein